MATTARKRPPCRPICAPASAGRRLSATAGPIRFTASGELASRDRRGLLALWLLCVRRRAEARRAGRHRARPARHPRPPAGREGRRGRRQGPAGAGGRLPGTEPALGAAAQRPVGRHLGRQRPPSGEDVRARDRRRPAEGGRLPHPGLAAVLRGGAARLRPSRPARRRRGDQRPGLRAVQRGAVDQGAGQGRLGRLAPGRHDALGQPGLGRGHPRLQLHGPALRLHRRQRRVGRAGLAQAGQDRHRGSWPPRPAPSGCPTPCRSSARRATSP